MGTALAFASNVGCGGLVADRIGSDAGAPVDASSPTDSAAVDVDACSSTTVVPSVVDLMGLKQVPVADGDGGVPAGDPSVHPNGATIFVTLLDRMRPGFVQVTGGTVSALYPMATPYEGPCQPQACSAAVSPAGLQTPGPASPAETAMGFEEWFPLNPNDSPPAHPERGAILIGQGYNFVAGTIYFSRGLRWSDLSPWSAFFDTRTLPQLADCMSFGHPAPWGPPPSPTDSLDLALTCRTKSGNRIVLLHSADRAKTFSFVSNLLVEGDASALGEGATTFDAPQIFEDINKDRFLVVATKSTATGPYTGCTTLPLVGSSLLRQCGKPVMRRRIVEKNGLPLGSCGYSGALGYVVGGVLPPGATPREQIFLLGSKAP